MGRSTPEGKRRKPFPRQTMVLSPLDLTILAAYIALTMVLGMVFSRKGTESIDAFFVSGRTLPWWLAGVSMIASAFAVDTPLGITTMVAENGIAGVWYAWSFVLGGAGMLGAFVFSALLRRSRVITIAEIAELRYDGKPAAFLRGWILKAVWTRSAAVVPDVNRHVVLGAILAFTLLYTAASGLWGIAATDFLQFIVGSLGSFCLAAFAWKHIGGVGHLVDGLAQRFGPEQAALRLEFFPSLGTPFFTTFLVFITLKWWGNPPPAVLQRIVASKDEFHASRATFLFSVVAFGLNYWPMILVALVSLVVFPDLPLANAEVGYARLIVTLLPSGLLGLMLASLVAAFMSTVDTHINYGASFMVNDIYRRFFVREASAAHYVRAAQVSTAVMLGVAVLCAYSMNSVGGAWYYMSMLTAGYGIVAVARWFWWRINAWSEISALLASLLGSTMLEPKIARALGYWDALVRIGWQGHVRLFGHVYFMNVTLAKWQYRFCGVILLCTVAWLIVTFLTPPTSEHRLVAFCRMVRPFPHLWKPIAINHPDIDWNRDAARVGLQWVLGVVATFAFCFGMGHLMFLRFGLGFFLLACSGVAMYALLRPFGRAVSGLQSR
jgi:SSS family solute:Na+ symporter